MKYYSRVAFFLSVPIVLTAIVLASLSVAHERIKIEPNWQVGDRWFVATELKRQEMIWKVADPSASPQDDKSKPQGNNDALADNKNNNPQGDNGAPGNNGTLDANGALKDDNPTLTATSSRPIVFQYDVLSIKSREHGNFHSAFLRITKALPETIRELGLPEEVFSNSEVELPISMVVLEVRIHNKEGGSGTYRGVSKFYIRSEASDGEERSEKVWLDGRQPITTNFALHPHDIPILTYPGRLYDYNELVVGEKDIFKREENGFLKLKVAEKEFPSEEKFVVKQTKNLIANSPVKVFWNPEQPWWSYAEDEKMKSWLLAVQRGNHQIRSGDLLGFDLEEEIPDSPRGLMETKALHLLPGIVSNEKTGRWE
ncbi:MAG: hypothetical protein HY391_02815, partial [Deltaproteobacteria bacterium]|nr:hypothetical protein [Deltaproteobacteria bacterium]